MRTILFTVSALALAACGAATSGAAAPETTIAEATAGPEVELPHAGVYAMDPEHTSVTFTVKHLGLSNYTVRFTGIGIDLTLDPADVSKSTLSATIDPASVDPYFLGDYTASHPQTGFQSWQQDLAESQNWFNATAFPEITYTATNIEQTGPDTAKITGDLTLLGVTRPVVLDAKYNGKANFPSAPDTDRIGFSATTVLKRSDFGMTAAQAFIGDEVSVYIESELTEVTE